MNLLSLMSKKLAMRNPKIISFVLKKFVSQGLMLSMALISRQLFCLTMESISFLMLVQIRVNMA
jgi:hypothetical protein